MALEKAQSATDHSSSLFVTYRPQALDAVRRIVPGEHPVLGRGIRELVDIKSDPYPGASVVPEFCSATYDRRLLVGETPESVLASVQPTLADLVAKDDELQVNAHFTEAEDVCYTGERIAAERFFPGWLFDADASWIQAIKAKLDEKGFSPEIAQYNFCTNGSHYAGEAGIRTIGLGPSREDLAHTVDEYIEISQITKAADCYYAVLEALLG